MFEKKEDRTNLSSKKINKKNKDSSSRREHQKKCKSMFDEALAGHTLYIHIDEIDYEENTVRFDVITDTMLDYDERFFSAENAVGNNRIVDLKGYRPYYFAFVTNYDKKYKACFEDSPCTLNKEFDDGKWYAARFIDDNQYEDYIGNRVLSGNAEYAASPVKYEKRKIEIIDIAIPLKDRDRINKGYTVNPCSDREVKDKFTKTFDGITFRNAFVYRTGKSNLIRLTGCYKDKRYLSVLYDVGVHKNNPGTLSTMYPMAGKALSSMKPQVVIISHWDADHYIGVVNANDSIYDALWFVPEIVGKKINAGRLVCYLKYKNKIIIAKRDASPREIAKVSGFSINMGINRNIDSTPENCGGIALAYEKNNVNTVLCGDVPYRAIRSILWDYFKIYDYIVVPHHASNRVQVNGIVSPSNDHGYGVVCHKKDKHDKELNKHVKSLEKLNYEIQVTEDAGLCYRIRLGRKEKPESIG